MLREYFRAMLGLMLLFGLFYVLLFLAGAGCSSHAVKRTPPPAPTATPVSDSLPVAQAEEGFRPIIGGYDFTPVYFDFDRAEIREDQAPRLTNHALVGGGSGFMLTGHCDERGSNDYNLALGLRRAYAVKTYLRRLGVKSDIECASLGEEQPADKGHSEAAWAKNRRVEFAEK